MYIASMPRVPVYRPPVLACLLFVALLVVRTATVEGYPNCGDPLVLLGSRSHTDALTFTYPARANYSCLPNMHYIRGVTWSQCLRNGSWSLLDILCSSRTCFYWRNQKAVYAGDVNISQSGEACQPWASQYPHKHTRDNILQFATDHAMSEVKNLCRDPDGEAIPWCYTQNRKVRWEVCNVPTCLRETCGNPPPIFGASVTFNLTHDPYSAKYACAEGYVRLRGGNAARCLFDGDWQLPPLLCVPTTCYRKMAGQALYAGNVSETKNGSVCQRWDQQTPHAHNFRRNKNFLADGGVRKAGNSCRDPSASGRPWCYVDSEQLFWDFCDVDECPDEKEQESGCGLPPLVNNASVLHTSTAEGATAYYRCLPASKNASGEITVAVCKSGSWQLPEFSCDTAPTSSSPRGGTTERLVSYSVMQTSPGCCTTTLQTTAAPVRRRGHDDVTAYVSLATMLGVLVPVLLAAILVGAVALHYHRKAKMLGQGDAAFSNLVYMDNNVSHI